MKKLLDAILVKLGLRHRSFTFLMPDDKPLSVEGIHCTNCTNSFWVEHTALELPTCCPYCCVWFEVFEDVDNDAFEEARGSSN